MKKAINFEKLEKRRVRCNVCQRRCLIDKDDFGFCQTRVNKNGELYTTIYGLISAANNDPVEKKPVFHFKPGSMCYSVGTFGCNFRCKFCQNWGISYADASDSSFEVENGQIVGAKELVKRAKSKGAKGIAWTYNEPAIWLEYSLDGAKIAKKEGLYTAWVTNGYATKETIDIIAPYLDVYRVDLKSSKDRFYQKLIGIPKASDVFETTLYVKKKYPKMHIECVTNVIPNWNDGEDDLSKISRWIVKNLGKKTAWHVTRYFPVNIPEVEADLPDFATTKETLIKGYEIGKKNGLEFVYIGNMAAEKGENTYCPKCGALNIKRNYYQTKILAVDKKGRCKKCGYDLNIVI